MITLLVFSRYQDIFDQFLASYERYGADDALHRRLLLTQDVKAPDNWKTLYYSDTDFVQTRAMNYAVRHTLGDVAFFSDDIEFTHERTLALLRDAAYSQHDVGAVSPMIDGGMYNGLQIGSVRTDAPLRITPALCYVCTYFKEQALRESDPWDESMIGFAWDDIDHSMSLGKAGWKCAVTPRVVVKHGFKGKTDDSTWSRRTDVLPNGLQHNAHLFEEKWRGRLGFLGDIVADSPINSTLKALQEGK